ncbi:MAG TPA: cytochrome c3 family protein [Phycisphaerae bacterium]|nr:cytochrome c3 family protein [Phycisphaerae bacterium]
MAQLFHPAMNTVARVLIVGIPLLSILAGSAIGYGFGYSDWVTYRQLFRQQTDGAAEGGPGGVPFSHAHHVKGLGIDCRYCHATVEQSPFAGMPSTNTCMTCHSQMWIHAPMLAPVRQSWLTNTPLKWTRVHDLPDYVYFDHSIHIAKGVGCSTCHGDVSEMPLMRRVVDLQMRWCLDCHRDPAKHLRPQDQIFNPSWVEPPDQLQRGHALLQQYHIQVDQLTNCSLCHR